MTTRDDAFPAGTPSWVDLSVADVPAARIFYEQLFGWQIQQPQEQFGGYANCAKDGRLVCGLAPTMAAEQPNAWTTYIGVADAAATMAQVRAHGGTVVAEPMAVMQLGTMAVALDPAGAPFGVWQPGTHTGFQRYNESGTVSWNEYRGADLAAAKAFYGAVFGWDYNDISTEGWLYSTFIATDGHEAGGLTQVADGDVGTPWLVYFSVDSADDTIDQLITLGGTVLSPAADTPYGRMATVADNQNATFAIVQPPTG
ncbi:MAG TPA: VOC family protein [Jatrophihabitans sp.]|nr:VOC family protein [Jatrophihabitans sp.]